MFDDEDLELYSEILPALWQGGTEDDDNIYHGQQRLPTMSGYNLLTSCVILKSWQ
jgi:hypothetical protein